MKAGDVLFWKSAKWWGKLVAKITNGKYYHVSHLVTDSIAVSIEWNGVKKVSIPQISKSFDVYCPNYPNERCRKRGIQYMLTLHESQHYYGFLNFMAFLWIKTLRKLKVRWFESSKFSTCSETEARCLLISEIKRKDNLPYSLYSPNSLLKSYDLKEATK